MKFPPASPEAIQRIKNLIDTGQILDSGFDDWKNAHQYVKLPNGKWVSKKDIPAGSPSDYTVKDYAIKPIAVNLAPEYTDAELYIRYKDETLLDHK